MRRFGRISYRGKQFVLTRARRLTGRCPTQVSRAGANGDSIAETWLGRMARDLILCRSGLNLNQRLRTVDRSGQVAGG